MKKMLNYSLDKITKVDVFIIILITLFYSILSFINLGSFKNPQTFYKLGQDQEIIVKLDKIEDVIKVKFYNGNISSKYQFMYSMDNEVYDNLQIITGDGAFAWKEERLLHKAKYIKIKSFDESSLGEIAFYDNSQNLIKIDEVIDSKTNKKIKKLTDEKDMIPEHISYLNSTYFDEIYFARTAYEYVNGIEAYEWTHPPLGKLLQAIPIKVTNTMAPFYYRLMGNIAGILMIIVMYFLGKELFKKRKYAIFSALLMVFDNFHFAQTRMGTVDSFLVLFIILSIYYMFRYIHGKSENVSLFLSGLFFGLASSVKWTGLYAGLGLAIIFFIHVIKNRKMTLKLFFKCLLFFVVIPLTIYISSYLLFPNIGYVHTTSIGKIIEQTKNMYSYHSKLDATHFFSSSWYTWPFSIKPVWYYTNNVLPNKHGSITGVGNVAIWWIGVVAVLYLIYRLFKKKDLNNLYILIIICSLWLPYVFIGRVMFLYHYFPVLPFVMISIVYLFYDLEEKIKTDMIIPMYLIIVIIVFIIYYPVVSGMEISNNYFENIKLFDTWYF